MHLRTFITTVIIVTRVLSLCNGQPVPASRDSTERITQLDEVTVRGRRLTERKFGIRRRGVVHFNDGMFTKNEGFEIGQVVRLGNSLAQVTSINLYISSDRADSATFRVNFYKYNADTGFPGQKINETIIQQTHPVKVGWLTFDLSASNVIARGDVLATIEFVPNNTATQKVLYDVKIGGTSKSYYRRDPSQSWMRPPHHYCLYVTGITDASISPELDDPDTAPTFILKSDYSAEPISVFIRLPKNYSYSNKQFPVVYLLDGNAYFDAVSATADLYARKKKIVIDPIIVGLGYEDAYIMDSLRNRDYTFPRAAEVDSFRVSGWGDRYYDFIESKIKPLIDSAYRIDKSNQTIMGHSLGGYFALYAFSRSLEHSAFNNFVAASPSLSYQDGYIVKHIDSLLNDNVNSKTMRLITTIGEYERSGIEPDFYDDLAKTLKDHRVTVDNIIYAKTEHMGTAIATFEQALILLFGEHTFR